MTSARAFALLALCALAAPAAAQTAPAASSPKADAPKPTGKDALTVVAPPPVDPKVVATFPTDGGEAASGIVILKIVFDQAMVAEAWSYAQSPDGAFPHCLKKPRLLPDNKSFALMCSVAPNLGYAVQINASPDFVSAHGHSAKPYLLRFNTNSDTVYDMHEALKRAGLTDADEPIMTWNAQPGGVTDTPPTWRKP